jgi:hypothetical protein
MPPGDRSRELGGYAPSAPVVSARCTRTRRPRGAPSSNLPLLRPVRNFLREQASTRRGNCYQGRRRSGRVTAPLP